MEIKEYWFVRCSTMKRAKDAARVINRANDYDMPKCRIVSNLHCLADGTVRSEYIVIAECRECMREIIAKDIRLLWGQ